MKYVDFKYSRLKEILIGRVIYMIGELDSQVKIVM